MTPSQPKTPTILILGPCLEAVSGVSTHLNNLLKSPLANEFSLIHFQVGSQGRFENVMGRVIRLLLSPFLLAFSVIRMKPSLVHMNPSMDLKSFCRDSVYCIVLKMLNQTVIWQVHGGAVPEAFCCENRIFGGLVRWILQLPDIVVVLTEEIREAYEAFHQFDELRVIPNAIDVVPYADHKTFPKNRDEIRLVYVGRVEQNKGVLDCIEALALLRAESFFEQLQLHIVGAGSAENTMKEKARKLGLESKIVFEGPRYGSEIVRVWKEADIFLFPTYHREGLPYTILESLAAGCPAITTRVGGIKDAVEDGVHGVFVEPMKPEEIAEAIRGLLADYNKIRSMSKRCVERAKEKYSIVRLVKDFSRLYRQYV